MLPYQDLKSDWNVILSGIFNKTKGANCSGRALVVDVDREGFYAAGTIEVHGDSANDRMVRRYVHRFRLTS